jgi:glycerol-3-phosphate acyltransferase PlsX
VPIRIAIDVMGGDHAPDAVMKGVIDALPILAPDEHLVLVGNGKRSSALTWMNGGSPTPVWRSFTHDDVIEMGDSPAQAVRTKPNSSIVVMAKLGSKKAEIPCDGVLSAGNTGACVAAGQMHMKRLPGVHRPGIAVTIPAFHGPIVLCDAGANPSPGVHLWQYGVMCSALRRTCWGSPPAGGADEHRREEGKGSDLSRRPATCSARRRASTTSGTSRGGTSSRCDGCDRHGRVRRQLHAQDGRGHGQRDDEGVRLQRSSRSIPILACSSSP